MTLKAGTIIATGTPAGVGMGMDPPQFHKEIQRTVLVSVPIPSISHCTVSPGCKNCGGSMPCLLYTSSRFCKESQNVSSFHR